MRESLAAKKERVFKIIRRLRKAYPDAKCALDHSNPMELLAATILSAQCTDKRVNLVTPALFKKCRSANHFARIELSELEDLVRTTGFYKSKAKNIQEAAKRIVGQHGGKVPARMEDLVDLPGVGRKTANVILGNAYGIPGLTVDTHMIRLNGRLGLTRHTDPVKIERDLMEIVPQKDWTEYSHLIIHHGRGRCFARKPDCAGCEVKDSCPSAFIAAGAPPREAARKGNVYV